jgi:translation elongation factor EF-1alpha
VLEGEDLVEIGRVTHFYTRINVAVIELTDSISVGNRIVIRGANTDFEQTVESMQIEHENVERAEAGQSIGLRVRDRTREGDVVYKVS